MFKEIRKLSDSKFAIMLILPTLILLLIIIFYPFINLITTSLLSYDNILIHSFSGLKNYNLVFSDQLFWQDLRRSLIYVFGSVMIFFISGFAVALSLHKINRFNAILTGISLLPWAIPPVTAATMWRWSLNSQYGIVNDILQRLCIISEPIRWITGGNITMITLIFVDAWIRIPFTALILLAGLKTIPQDIYESASIDGAGPIQKFTYITLPNLKYPISIVLILQTMFAFRTYDILAILTGGGPGRETELLVKYVLDSAFKDYQFGIASAVSIVMIVICIFSSLIYWKSLKIEV